jgi:membrane-associated protein
MHFTPAAILGFLTHYGYIAAFGAMFLTGPTGDVLSGLLAGAGVFNPIVIIVLSVISDILTDIMYYELGRWGGKRLLARMAKFFHWSNDFIEKAEKHFEAHGRKTLLIVKFSHGVGALTQVIAGMTHMPRRKYLTTNIIGGAIQSTILVMIGVLAGASWQAWLARFENVGTAVTIVIAVGIVLLAGYFFIGQKFIRKNPE